MSAIVHRNDLDLCKSSLTIVYAVLKAFTDSAKSTAIGLVQAGQRWRRADRSTSGRINSLLFSQSFDVIYRSQSSYLYALDGTILL